MRFGVKKGDKTQKIAILLSMHNEGKRVDEMAREADLSESTVRAYLQEAGRLVRRENRPPSKQAIRRSTERAALVKEQHDYYTGKKTGNQMSMLAVGQLYGVTRQQIEANFKSYGLETRKQGQKPVVKEEMKVPALTISLSDRLANTYTEFGIGSIKEGIDLLSNNIESFKYENIGTNEKPSSRRIRLDRVYAQKLNALVDKISITYDLNHGLYSMVIRNALELFIDKHGVTKYTRPEGWEPKPLSLRQGGQSPIATDEATNPVATSLPHYVWNFVKHLRLARGAIKESEQMSLSKFCRLAIDRMDERSIYQYQFKLPHLPSLRVAILNPCGLNVYERQLEIIDLVRAKHKMSVSEFFTALILQAAALQTVPEASIQPVETSQNVVNMWDALVETNSVTEVADLYGLTEDQTLDIFRASGYINK